MSTQFKFDLNDDTTNDTVNESVPAIKTTTLSLDTIASTLLKHNFILTALEFHTELAESGRELTRLRDYFSNPANFEQISSQNATTTSNINNYPLHKTPSIQTFDSLDLTRYSDDTSEINNKTEDKVALLEFELRKAKETISQLRYTLTIATENETLLSSPSSQPQASNKQLNHATITTNTNSTNSCCFDENGLNHNHVNALLPHEKNAINFLVNEYLLLQNYKMTSVTFSEENESQDLEDWDVVGLNRSKPPNLINLYRFYNNYQCQNQHGQKFNHKKNDLLQTVNVKQEVLVADKSDFQQNVNLDESIIESQSNEIENLNEKQKSLLNKIEQLKIDIDSLNNERELFIKKIDLLTTMNNDLKKRIQIEQEEKEQLKEQQQQQQQREEIVLDNEQQHEHFLNEVTNKYEKFKFERKIPILFQEKLDKYLTVKLNDENDKILKEINSINSNQNNLIGFIAKCLPNLVANIVIQKKIDLLPLIVYAAILQETSNERDSILKLLFNLIKKPDIEQRAMILAGCACFAKHAGPDRANNELLPQCWEQINNKYDEIRVMVADSCAILAPFIGVDIRGSLMLSILKQIILQDKCEDVRVNATKSLGLLVNYIQDEEKFLQCIELLDYCLNDTYNIQINANLILVPSLALWALELNKLTEPFINYYLKLIDKVIVNTETTKQQLNEKTIARLRAYINLLKNLLQYIYACVLNSLPNDVNCVSSVITNTPTLDTIETNNTITNGASPLLTRSYSKYSVKMKKSTTALCDLYNLDLIIEKANVESLKASFYYKMNDANTSIFNEITVLNWIENEFIKKLISIMTLIDAKSSLTNDFIEFFQNFCEIFGCDYVKLRIIPLFNEILNVKTKISDNELNIELNLTSKSILSVYYVAILSICYYDEVYDDCTDSSKKTNDSFEYLNNYLKNLLIQFSLNEISIKNLCIIYDQLSKTSKAFHLQILLSTLWEGIVHASSNVRCYTARLFEVLVKNIEETILSNRVLPALITLANDPEKVVRCSSISSLCGVIENCSNKEILERVYTQLQLFLNDPNLKDDYDIKIELIKAFKRIVVKIDNKFREEFLLPYLTILTMQTMQAQHALLSLHENKSQEIICLLFDVYNSLSCCTISRQSTQESVLPGLNCLKQILHENQILYSDKLKTIDVIINEFEQKMQLYQQSQQQQQQIHVVVNNHSNTNNTDLNSSVSSNSTNSTPTMENNFKQFVFKGFTNSKDKFSSLLSAKKH